MLPFLNNVINNFFKNRLISYYNNFKLVEVICRSKHKIINRVFGGIKGWGWKYCHQVVHLHGFIQSWVISTLGQKVTYSKCSERGTMQGPADLHVCPLLEKPCTEQDLLHANDTEIPTLFFMDKIWFDWTGHLNKNKMNNDETIASWLIRDERHLWQSVIFWHRHNTAILLNNLTILLNLLSLNQFKANTLGCFSYIRY